MPKKNPAPTSDAKAIAGKVALLKEVKDKIKSLQKQESELKAAVLNAVEKQGTVNGTYKELETVDGTKVRVQFQERESFDVDAAVLKITGLPLDVQDDYILKTTTKDLVESAYHNDHLSVQDLEELITVKIVKVVTFPK